MSLPYRSATDRALAPRLVCLCVAAVLVACSSAPGSRRPSSPAPPRPREECDLEALARALAADTGRLRRSEASGSSTQSSEGAEIVEFRDGDVRRVLSITLLGGRGRASYVFHFANSESYVVRIVEEAYEAPISENPTAAVRARYEQLLYICAGAPTSPPQNERWYRSLSLVLREAERILRERGEW